MTREKELQSVSVFFLSVTALAWTPSLVCFDGPESQGPEKSGDLIVSLFRCNHGSRQLASRQMFNVAGGLVTCATQPRSPVSVAVFPGTSATPYTKFQPHQVRVKDRFHAYILVWRLDQLITPSTDFAVLTTTRNCRRLGFSHGRNNTCTQGQSLRYAKRLVHPDCTCLYLVLTTPPE